jgi:hypothetical protein
MRAEFYTRHQRAAASSLPRSLSCSDGQTNSRSGEANSSALRIAGRHARLIGAVFSD